MAVPPEFQNRRDVSEELKALLKATEGVQRGDVVSYERIQEATGMVRRDKQGNPSRGWGSLIRQWRAAMELRGFCVKRQPIPNVGYPILDAKTHGLEADKERRFTERHLRRQAIYLGLTPQEGLSEEERRMIVGKLGQVAEQKQIVDRHKKERQLWLTKKDTLPRLEKPQEG